MFSKTIIYTIIALLAFAGNSILCRLALGENSIDAASFTIIRLISGAVVLSILLAVTARKPTNDVNTTSGSWLASIMLFIYAIGFSYAYISLETGVGALVLFAAVQLTMIIVSLIQGNRFSNIEFSGIIIAFSGFVYLVFPALTSPSLTGFILMTLAGIAWGVYSIIGRHSVNPLADTTFNFIRTVPFALLLLLVTIDDALLSFNGIVYAALSGGLASGIGYAIWYIALSKLSASIAAVSQLMVPVIAGAGGVLFASEQLSMVLIISTMIILGGILLVVFGNQLKHHS